jgi:uncharacterized membrane protein
MMMALRERKVFTVRDYHKMIDAGVFVGDSDYELVEGEIVKKMPRVKQHITSINRLNMLFAPRLVGEAIVSIQNAAVISDVS